MIRQLSPQLASAIRLAICLLVLPAIASAQGPLTNGGNHSASISAPGEIDEWTFTANLGNAILLSVGEVVPAGPDPGFQPWIRLRRPDGVEIGSDAGQLAATLNVTAPLSGTYTVLVRDNTFNRPGTALGSYNLHFVIVPGDPIVPGSDEGGALSNGGTHAGRIGAPGAEPTARRGDLDVWTFQAAQDDGIVLSVGEVLDTEADPGFVPWIRLYGPTGQLLAENAGTLAAFLYLNPAPLTGTYTVVVSDYTFNREGSAVGDYLLHLVKSPGALVSPDDGEGGPMTNGANHAGRIGAPGATPTLHRADLDAWTFTANQNDAIVLSVAEVLNSEIDPGFVPWIRLFGPNGDLLGSQAGNLSAFLYVNPAPLSGTYTVLISDYTFNREGSAVGDYIVHLLKSPGTFIVPTDDEGGPMTNGANHAGRIGAQGPTPTLHRGDLDTWSFTASQNDAIVLSVGEVLNSEIDPGFVPWIRLFGPNGDLLGSNAGNLSAFLYVNPAPLSGTYTVLISDYTFNREGSAVGDYIVHLLKSPGTFTVPTDDEGGPMINGANHAGRIGAQGPTPTLHRGDLDTWSFTADQNDAIVLSVGEVLDSEIDPGFVPWIRLFGPNGQLLGSNAGTFSAFLYLNPAPLTGTYTVVISDYTFNREGSAVGDYIVHLLKSPGTFVVPTGDDGGPMTNGANHTGRIGAPGATPTLHRGDLDAWSFTASQNDAIILSVGEILDSEVDPGFVPWIRLFGPDGDLLGSNAGNLAAFLYVNPAPLTGTYSVVISDYTFNREGLAVGDYFVHLVKTPGTAVVPAGDEGGPMTNGANYNGRIGAPGANPRLHRADLDVWTFCAAQGAALTISISEVVPSPPDPDFVPWIRLFRPNGVLAGSDAGATSASININAPASGLYTLVVSDNTFNREGATVGDYVLSAFGLSACPTTPTTVADSYSTPVNMPLSVAAPGVLGNDNSNGGGAMTGQLVTNVTTGTLAFNTNGGFTYTPPAGFIGPVTFTYQAVNSAGAGNTATVTITVVQGPGTVADSYTTAMNTTLSVPAPGVLGNDNTNGGGAMTAQIVTNVTTGTLALNANGSFTYTPPQGFTGSTSFSYRAVNSVGAGNEAAVTLTVTPVPPTTVNDSYATRMGTPLNTPAPGILGNDLANGGCARSAQLLTTTANGILALASDGSFNYTPNPGFHGSDGFTYRAVNNLGPGNAASVSIDVQNPTEPQPPTELYAAGISGNLVKLRFKAPTSGPAPTGYLLEGGLVPGQVLASIPTGSTNPIYVFSAPSGVFYVRMHTLVGSARSVASNEIRIYVNASVDPPSAPAHLTGLANGNSVALAWRNTFAGGAPANVVLDVRGSLNASLPLGLTDNFQFNGVPGGTYTLSVRAINATGSSPSSNAITLTFPSTTCVGPPLPPSEFLAYRLGSTIYVEWQPAAMGPAPTSYALTVTGSFNGTLGTPGRSLSGAVGRGTYHLSVAALNACGGSTATAAQTVVVP